MIMVLDSKSALKKNGVGIVNIINRVESFNGKVDFETNPGVGCKLDIRIPMVSRIENFLKRKAKAKA